MNNVELHTFFTFLLLNLLLFVGLELINDSFPTSYQLSLSNTAESSASELKGVNPLLKFYNFITTQFYGSHELLPLNSHNILVLIAVSSAAFLSAGAGIGGGGILLPIYAILGGFNTRAAVALTNLTVFGGSLGNLCCNIGRRHPRHGGSLIDWDIIVMMEPSTIVGAILGSYVNAVLPVCFTNVLLASLLTFVDWTLLKRFVKLFAKETHDINTEHRLAERQREIYEEIHQIQNQVHLARQAAAQSRNSSGRGHQAQRGAKPSPTLDTKDALAQPLLSDVDQADLDPKMFIESTRDLSLTEMVDTSVEGVVKAVVLEQKKQEAEGGDVDEVDPSAVGIPGPDENSFSGFNSLNGNGNGNGQGEGGVVVPAGVTLVDLEEGQGGESCCSLARRKEAFLKDRCRRVPLSKVLLLLGLTAWLIVTDEVKACVPCGSPAYWLAVVSVLPPIAFALFISRRRLVHEASLRRDLRIPFLEGDIAWDRRNTVIFPALCTGAGVVAGLFGIGGGIVKGPIMLEIGVLPEVTAATTATMILFTAGTASMVFLRFHYVSVGFSAAAFVIGFISSLSGHIAISRLIAYLRRRSIIVFVMFALSTASMAVMYGRAVHDTAVAVRTGGASLVFGSVCPKHA